MMPAQYFCSGEIPKDQWHHYGLAAPVYTHFTSPIRRYADIIVHRLLAAAIGVIPLPAINADRSKQQDLCSHLNRRHKAAQYAQRASVNLHTLLYFRNRPSTETAYVLSVSEEQIGIIVQRFGIEGSIALAPIADDLKMSIRLDALSHTVILESAPGKGAFQKGIFSFQVFQKVQVSIRVKEHGSGNRALEIALVVDGKDFGSASKKRKL
jgi:exosome complex exonuclease DIS3/RRP44